MSAHKSKYDFGNFWVSGYFAVASIFGSIVGIVVCTYIIRFILLSFIPDAATSDTINSVVFPGAVFVLMAVFIVLVFKIIDEIPTYMYQPKMTRWEITKGILYYMLFGFVSPAVYLYWKLLSK